MDEIERKEVEEIITAYLAKLSLRAWAFLGVNIIALMGGLITIYGWTKDVQSAITEVRDGIKTTNAIKSDVDSLKKWQAERVIIGNQWNDEISKLQNHDDEQSKILIRLLEGQAEIKAEIRKNK